MPRRHCKASVSLVLLVLYPLHSNAVNFSQCLVDVTSCATHTIGQDCIFTNMSNTTAFSILRTSQGSPIPLDSDYTETATALSFTGCVAHCGRTQEPFSWTVFSQEYSAWLLPYLALLSQLPFGARRRTDNLMSAVVTLGSPTLAGYSLYITLLNARWLNDKVFAEIDYPSATVRQAVVRVLSSLQQVPLRIHPGNSARFESLVVLPDNDIWWSTLAEELDYSHTWSIASATSITWVVVAYLLTVADSFSNVADHINSNGQGTGSVWLWLLPIVVGWLVLSPKCDYKRVHDAYDKANRQVFAADSSEPTPIPVDFDFGVTIGPTWDWKLPSRSVTSSPDESLVPPVFNYARSLSWSRTAYIVSLFYRAAWRKSNRREGVNGNHIPGSVRSDVPPQCRVGNREQIINYCTPDNREWPELDTSLILPPGVLFNMIVASLMSLQLQWGTTMAAVLVAYYTPTVGLGCRSLAYLVYGALSTAVWFLLISSSALGYYARHLTDGLPTSDLQGAIEGRGTPSTVTGSPGFLGSVLATNTRANPGGTAIPLEEIQDPATDAEGSTAPWVDSNERASSLITMKQSHTGQNPSRAIICVADWLRWIGKLLAILNAIVIVANSVFQYAGVYDTCYCNSSVFTWGRDAFNVVNPDLNDISLATSAWIGGFALALASCSFFVGTIYLMRDSLPS